MLQSIRGRPVSRVAVVVCALALVTTGCCSRTKRKADEYKSERDDYRAKLIRAVQHADAVKAELQLLKARLAQQAHDERTSADIDRLLALLQLVMAL